MMSVRGKILVRVMGLKNVKQVGLNYLETMIKRNGMVDKEINENV